MKKLSVQFLVKMFYELCHFLSSLFRNIICLHFVKWERLYFSVPLDVQSTRFFESLDPVFTDYALSLSLSNFPFHRYSPNYIPGILLHIQHFNVCSY